MSSRSKEKALNAIRKLFKGGSSSSNNINNNNNNNNNSNNINNNHINNNSNNINNNNSNSASSNNNNNSMNNNNNNPTANSTGSNKAEENATTRETTNAAPRVVVSGVNANGDGGGSAAEAIGAAAPNDSPGKRLRRQDNKISPASSTSSKMLKMTGGIPNPPDFSIRARRLMKEYKEIQKIQSSNKETMFTVELINDSLYEWYARLHVVDPDSKLAKDMVELNIPFILLHLVFPDNFPFAPPFMRVVEPRIEKGFVMEGGAICMELLTPRGWASAYTVEAVLMQFAASLVKGQGRIVRKPKSSKEFSKRSAEEAFRSLVKTHDKYGWVTPSLSDG